MKKLSVVDFVMSRAMFDGENSMYLITNMRRMNDSETSFITKRNCNVYEIERSLDMNGCFELYHKRALVIVTVQYKDFDSFVDRMIQLYPQLYGADISDNKMGEINTFAAIACGAKNPRKIIDIPNKVDMVKYVRSIDKDVMCNLIGKAIHQKVICEGIKGKRGKIYKIVKSN